MASARNDKLFTDGSDLIQLAKETRYVIGGSEEVAKTFRVIALPRNWLNDPWTGLDESEQPERWDDRLPILVLPEEPDRIDERLGRWLKDHLQKRRNTVRFLIPRSGTSNAFYDRDLLVLARAEMKAQEWGAQNAEYRKLQSKYQGELRDILKKRFDRFAVLHTWNFGDPSKCEFHIETLREQGAKVPEAIETAMTNDLFVPEDFEHLVLEAAINNSSVGKLLKELQEPRPAGEDCIPWLGETAMKERILRLCAKGKIAINLREWSIFRPSQARTKRPRGDACGRSFRTRDDSLTRCSSCRRLLFPRPGANPQPAPGTQTPSGLFGGAQSRRLRLREECLRIRDQCQACLTRCRNLVAASSAVAPALARLVCPLPHPRPRRSTLSGNSKVGELVQQRL
ncbi:hypothetical protein FLP41_14065 [Paracoccus marcusii]|uniref:hypothetical protein n=1 Tax=Paracoccus marcusii TaxID=59779 RepID=UPI002ED2F321|nr:hypothetical protein FLP41_14065 [Paracoccus marcusii]